MDLDPNISREQVDTAAVPPLPENEGKETNEEMLGWPVNVPFALDEVRTVMAFCIRRITKLDPGDIQHLNRAMDTYDGCGRRGPEAEAAAADIIAKYNKLNDLLEPMNINGASVCDSSNFD